jgi:hypothetical protein
VKQQIFWRFAILDKVTQKFETKMLTSVLRKLRNEVMTNHSDIMIKLQKSVSMVTTSRILKFGPQPYVLEETTDH